MKFISAKLLKPPTVTPIEYCYNARDDGCGDEIRVRCEEWPVPEVVQQLQLLSRPVVDKFFGSHVANAPRPFRFIVYGLERKDAGDNKPWGEEVAFNILIGQQGREVKIKTPFFALYDTYQGKVPGAKENRHPEVLGADLTEQVRHMITLFLGYMNGERAQQELHFDDQVDVRDERLPEHCTAADMPMIPGLDE